GEERVVMNQSRLGPEAEKGGDLGTEAGLGEHFDARVPCGGITKRRRGPVSSACQRPHRVVVGQTFEYVSAHLVHRPPTSVLGKVANPLQHTRSGAGEDAPRPCISSVRVAVPANREERSAAQGAGGVLA